jgi:hypothetical protein
MEQSLAQGRLWFFDHLKQSIYPKPFTAPLRGYLSYQAALHTAENRPYAFSTNFFEQDDVYKQVVQPSRGLGFKLIYGCSA